MKTTILGHLAAALVMLAAGLSAAFAASADDRAKFDRDRQAILAMAGDYKVRFDMRETVSFLPDYTPLPPKVSGGHEIVRVIEDTGRVIKLQHLLVVEHDGKTMVIKHWRQDWTYEPTEVLTYSSLNRWTVTPVPAAARKGAWSQTVWQTDDSPRYGGVGQWRFDGGVARWMSDETARPLARRDAVRHPPYDHYVGTNRHAITPNGWVHEQDNAKIGMRDGKPITFTHEVVLNTYARVTGIPNLVAAGETYWARTRDYWAQVRTAWDAAIARGHGISVEEKAENGSVTGPKLMGLADDIAQGKITTEAAIVQAKTTIETTRVADAGRPNR
jgi:hypothetical protein